jgi:DNA-binding beta-propeller fold protein YncE
MNALGRTTRGLAATALLFAFLFAISPAGASAAAPKTLWTGCTSGTAAGNCSVPRGIAADPKTGRLYVADQGNRRIVELTAWGEFVRAWGWGVRDGAAELQTCTPATGCGQGLKGNGAGQFDVPQGLTIDSAGDIYVVDLENRRVEKFDPTGPGGEVQFLFAFGGPGTGNGQFGAWEIGSFIDIGPGDNVYVGDQGRVQVFDSSGNYLKSILLPGETVQSLVVDPTSGAFYVSYFRSIEFNKESKEGVRKFSPSGELLCTAPVRNPRALALDANGDLYVAENNPTLPHGSAYIETEIRKFNSACQEYPDYGFIVEKAQSPNTSIETTGIATNTVTTSGGIALYYANLTHGISYVRAYYPVPDKPAPFDQPPLRAPSLLSQYAVSVDSEGATLRAQINPHFWGDASYYVEYGTEPCSLGGCQTQPPPPGAQLGAGVIDESATTSGVFLHDLQPGTTYHYRFVSQSSGGGPVSGSDSTFTTFPQPGDLAPCPNDALRTGAAAKLPDCRAYEMVSPIDKNGGDIEALEGLPGSAFGKHFLSRLDQAAPGGERITYSAARAFAGAVSSPWTSQYISARDPVGGWATESINPLLGSILLYGQRNQEIQFKSFSEDLCSAWVIQGTDLTLAPGAPDGVPNLYRQRGCDETGYELLTTVAPPGFSRSAEPQDSRYVPEIQGSTTDAAHSFVRANATLTPDASASDIFQLYETSPSGDLQLVSILPSGAAPTVHSSLGTATALSGDFRNDSVATAVAQDGSRVFWTASTGVNSETPSKFGGGGEGFQPGEIYLRANPLAPAQAASGECAEPNVACTVGISGPNSKFWMADPAGSRVIYQTAEKLFEAQIEEEGEALVSHSTLIADGVAGVVGGSRDTKRIYLVSSKELATGAVAGKPNLYLHEMGEIPSFRLVATLSSLDSGLLSLDSFARGFHTSRVTPDGERVAFLSQESLTGYDNTDANSGQADAEAYLYDAGANGGAGQLDCISCNPSGARPSGRNIGVLGQFWVSAQLPAWASQLHPTRLLADDGSRLFFESYDALVLSDTNEARDVYEWEAASSQEECDQLGATLFVPSAGGCLSLISSGESPQDSEFIDASSDGRDVFFTTNESLFSEDPGLIDIYDAREGGGFAAKTQPPSCQGEACQPPASAPSDPTPTSSAFQGAGNVKEGTPGKPRCPKGKRKARKGGKARCVKRKPSQRSKGSNHSDKRSHQRSHR